MEQSVQSTSQSPTKRSCDEEGEYNFNHPIDILRKKGNDDNDMTENIEKGICKSANNVDGNGKFAGTSKPLKTKQAAFNIDLQQPRNIFNTSVRGICSDFVVPLRISDDQTNSYSRHLVEEDPHNLHLQSGVDNTYRRVNLFPSVWDLECDDFNGNGRSLFLACEKKNEVLFKSERSMSTCLRDIITSPFQAVVPSTSKNPSPAFSGEGFQKIWNFSGPSPAFSREGIQKIWNFSSTKHIPSSARLSEKNSFKMSDHEFNTNAKFESLFNEMETTRICNTVDSVVGLSGRHSRFSQTSQSLLITKTDFNLFKETDPNYDSDMHSFSKVGRAVHHGVKLRSLPGFTDFGVQEKAKNINKLTKFANGEETKADDAGDLDDSMHRKGKRVVYNKGLCFDLNSESSAGTDIMELYDFQKNSQGYDVNSFPPVKVIKLGSTTRRLVFSSGSEEDGSRRHKTTLLPDMNFEPLISTVEEQMLDYEEPNTSRTQSLDKETVLAYAEQDNPLESTKNLTKKSHHKRNKLSVERFGKGGVDSLKTIASMNHGKELMVLDNTTTLKADGTSSYIDSAKKDRDVLLSKSWIRRWCYREEATPNKNPTAKMAGEPRSSNILLKGIEKKQFPNIGAMAKTTIMPDMNCEALISPVEEQMLDYEEPITSKTQSLDKENVLAYAKQDNPLESTKNLMEKSHHKRNKLSVEIFLKGGVDSLKTTAASTNQGKEVLDDTTTLKPDGTSSYIDSAKKDRDVLLSKSWIRRWCHREEATPNKNHTAEMTGEPRSSNILLKDIEKKPLPSIGAMAMLAKAMTCSERFDIHNRGAFVVWNTKDF